MKLFLLIIIVVILGIIITTTFLKYQSDRNKIPLVRACELLKCKNQWDTLTNNCDLSKMQWDEYDKCRKIYKPPYDECIQMCKNEVGCKFC